MYEQQRSKGKKNSKWRKRKEERSSPAASSSSSSSSLGTSFKIEQISYEILESGLLAPSFFPLSGSSQSSLSLSPLSLSLLFSSLFWKTQVNSVQIHVSLNASQHHDSVLFQFGSGNVGFWILVFGWLYYYTLIYTQLWVGADEVSGQSWYTNHGGSS